MTGKEILSFVLRWSSVWAMPFQIAIAILSAKEAVKGGVPVKTIAALSSFSAFMFFLLMCWNCAD